LSAASDTPEQMLLDEVVRDVARALRVPLCKVLELESTRRWFTVVAGVGWQPGVVGTGYIPVGTTTLAGLTLQVETPVVCDDLPRARSLSDAALLRRHGVVSSVSAVVGSPDEPVGVLSAHATARREFTPAETRFLAQAAVVLADGLRRRRATTPTLFRRGARSLGVAPDGHPVRPVRAAPRMDAGAADTPRGPDQGTGLTPRSRDDV
jgi:GAF domain-containing protein